MTAIRLPSLLTCSALTCLAVSAGTASAQTATDWSGFYIGGSVGYATPNESDDESVLFDTNLDGRFNDTVRTTAGADAFSPGFCDGAAVGRTPAEGCRDTVDNVSYALRAGYDWQFGGWVVGALGEFSQANIGTDVTAFSTTPASYTFNRDVNTVIAVRGRLGYAWDRFLAYGAAGYAQGDIDHSFSTTNGANSFTPTGDDEASGYQVGGGLEWAFTDNWSFGLEYLYTSLEDDDYTVRVGRGTAPVTNPFLLVNATGTDMRRSEANIEFGTINATVNWRY